MDSPDVAVVTGSPSGGLTPLAARSAAFVRLAEVHLDGSYRLARAILGTWTDAEDATQDALVQAWRKWSQLRDSARFEPWFHRILVNVCRERLRRQSRGGIRDVSAELASIASAGSLDSIDDREQIRTALSRLSPDHRIAVTLRYYLDLSIDDIAERTGVPVGTVSSRLHYALRQMREGMDR
jgi:RNA polymerase sigma-70 factor (ECF subfamily)